MKHTWENRARSVTVPLPQTPCSAVQDAMSAQRVQDTKTMITDKILSTLLERLAALVAKMIQEALIRLLEELAHDIRGQTTPHTHLVTRSRSNEALSSAWATAC